MSEAAYPSYAEIRARHIAERRALAIAAAREAAAAAARHGVRLVVFGSLAEGRFHRDSDLDVALDGPEDRLAAAEGEVFDVVSGHGLPVDVVRLSHAPPRLAERIRVHGRDPATLD